MLQLYEQATGRLACLLLDEGVLTELRTAAMGSLAVRLWGPKTVDCIGIVGTGVQARYQLRMLQHVTDCRTVVVWGRDPVKAQALCDELAPEGWTIHVVDSITKILSECNVIVTTTSAREPVLAGGQPRDGSILVAIGSDAPGKQELSTDLSEGATRRIADSEGQSRERGEYQRLSKGAQVWSLPEAFDHSGPLTTGYTIFDSSGVAVQDCVVAQMVYDALA